ncbi:MAG: hypothetical protein HYT03_03185 [Candidatus Harrisonbacteria bacterium]|nr:hypothetical protein [Candidatus Harrisonbacteria bacterium]
MKNFFWPKYKIGLLILILPIVLIYLVYFLISTIWSFAAWFNGLTFSSGFGQWLWFVVWFSIPFFVGLLFSGHRIGNIFLRMLSWIPIVDKFVKLIACGNWLDKIKNGEHEAVIFEVTDRTWKLGALLNSFVDKEGEEYYLILEVSPSLSLNFWIKKKDGLKFLEPDYNFTFKDLLVTVFSIGLNFPLGRNNRKQNSAD